MAHSLKIQSVWGGRAGRGRVRRQKHKAAGYIESTVRKSLVLQILTVYFHIFLGFWGFTFKSACQASKLFYSFCGQGKVLPTCRVGFPISTITIYIIPSQTCHAGTLVCLVLLNPNKWAVEMDLQRGVTENRASLESKSP